VLPGGIANILHRDTIAVIVGSKVFERGEECFASGRVLHVDAGRGELRGAVRPQEIGRAVYSVRIWVREEGLAYECTCPMGEQQQFCKHAVAIDGRASVFAVVGTDDDGLVVAGSRSALVLARSRAGTLTADRPIEIEQLAFATDPAGRALVAYNDVEGALHGFVARGAAPARPIELGAARAGGACLTAKRGWIAGPETDQIVAFDPETGAVTPYTYAKHDLLGCTADAALLHERNATHYVVCAGDCRVAALQGMRPSKIATLAGAQVVAAVVRDQVLGVWREQGPPAYYDLGKQLDLQLAVSDGKALDLVAESGDGLVIVRVPAK